MYNPQSPGAVPEVSWDPNLGFLAGHRTEATELLVECVVVCFQLGKLTFRQGGIWLLPWPPRAPTLVIIPLISSEATISVVQ